MQKFLRDVERKRMNSLKGKVVVITGASRGIGAEIAREFAARQATVVVSDRNSDRLQMFYSELKDITSESMAIVTDIRMSDQVKHLMDETLKKFQKIDVLINNAGITMDNLLMRMSESEWDQVVETNLKGTFNCIKAVTRQMMKQRSGKIINITSVVGLMGNAGQSNYAASKAGVIGLTRSVARELASRNITCNAVAPGFIETEMTAKLDEKSVANLKSQIPLARLGTTGDVAKVVCFLAGDEADYVTGQVINVDGGMVMN
jgi:3-oxoacyl-[acyl-carrier protein] reductase